ncbi:hypothetical protein [Pseudanabaena sp. FACHB-2040]|uniref:hypothetical protein n=1 Tax=Pseudanabaena sp. FACHB-2040 TaxID=2692859 RepID=UPI0016881048|nr:hypothetical protein [Pseudanabaena sp. FACHB-2040]MBD2260058.1 hypothetical protein [Pseudanabaena sp. FACHB-2040]
MDRIKDQANKVGQLLLAPDTGAAYTKTLTLTWIILRETGVLVWLVICLFFVGADWFWNNSIQLGGKARIWYNGLSQKAEGTATQPLGTTGQSLLEAVKSGAMYLLAQARQQLGLKEEVPVASAPSPTPPLAPKPVPMDQPKPLPIVDPTIPEVVPAAEEDREEI